MNTDATNATDSIADIEVSTTSNCSPFYWFRPKTEKGRALLGGSESKRCRNEYLVDWLTYLGATIVGVNGVQVW